MASRQGTRPGRGSVSGAGEVERLRAKIARLRAQRDGMADVARKKIREERAHLKAEAARLRARTQPLLKKATEELSRLAMEIREAREAQARAEQESARLRERVRALESRAGAPAASGARAGPPPLQGPPSGRARTTRTGTQLMPAMPATAAAPPIPPPPSLPGFLRSTQIIDTGKAAVWQDNAERVIQVDVARPRSSRPPVTERPALRPEDLESQDLLLDLPDDLDLPDNLD